MVGYRVEIVQIYNKRMKMLIQGDSAKILKEIPSQSIDLCLTSPPYDDARDYNGYSFEFEVVAKELFRVIKNGGVLVWVVADQTKNPPGVS